MTDIVYNKSLAVYIPCIEGAGQGQGRGANPLIRIKPTIEAGPKASKEMTAITIAETVCVKTALLFMI